MCSESSVGMKMFILCRDYWCSARSSNSKTIFYLHDNCVVDNNVVHWENEIL